MVEHRYKSNDYPGAFGGFEWRGDITDLLHTPGWFADYVQEISLVDAENDAWDLKTPATPKTLYFITTDNRRCAADPGDIVLFRHGKIVVCTPDIVKFFLQELM